MTSVEGIQRHQRRNNVLRLSTRKVIIFYFGLAMTVMMISFLALESTTTIESQQLRQQKHDPYRLRNNSPLFNTSTNICLVPPGQGEEGPAGIRGLYKIQQALPKATTTLLKGQKEQQLQRQMDYHRSETTTKSQQQPRIFCMVYTHSNRHETALTAITETYAPQCDGFLAASNLTEPQLGAYKVPHHGDEKYENIWNKVQAMWFFAYQHYLFDFDWFHIGGDDMFVIPENLRRLGYKYNKAKVPLYLGASIPNSKNPARRFCGGGAGYTLNRYALHLLVQRMMNGACPAETAPDEDVRMGRCLEDAGVQCHDTNDEYGEEGGEVRYHHLDVQFHASWTPSRHALWHWDALQVMHGIRGNQTLLGQISNTSTSFHLDKTTVRSISPDRGIRRYYAILFQKCGSDFQKQVEWAATCTKEERDNLHKEWRKIPTQKMKKKKQQKQKEEESDVDK